MAASGDTEVWLCEAVPDSWSETVLLPLFEKGGKRICYNHRDISLIDVAAKVFGDSIQKIPIREGPAHSS